jgi:hypothetical protein
LALVSCWFQRDTWSLVYPAIGLYDATVQHPMSIFVLLENDQATQGKSRAEAFDLSGRAKR